MSITPTRLAGRAANSSGLNEPRNSGSFQNRLTLTISAPFAYRRKITTGHFLRESFFPSPRSASRAFGGQSRRRSAGVASCKGGTGLLLNGAMELRTERAACGVVEGLGGGGSGDVGGTALVEELVAVPSRPGAEV